MESKAGEYFSIEKQDDFLVIQQSNSKRQVAFNYNGVPRRTGYVGVHVYKSVEIKPAFTMDHLVLFIQKEQLVLERYHVATANCQHFSIKLFNFITAQNVTIADMNTATDTICRRARDAAQQGHRADLIALLLDSLLCEFDFVMIQTFHCHRFCVFNLVWDMQMCSVAYCSRVFISVTY